MLYRDRENGIVLGVCAGIADRFELNLTGVRVLVALIMFFSFWTMLIVYVVAGLVLPDRPLNYFGSDREQQFWRSSDNRME